MNISTLRDLVTPRLEDRVPLDLKSLAIFFLPVCTCYYSMAVLVLLPGARLYRLALLPLALFLTWTAATRSDASAGMPEYNHNNYGHCVIQFVVSLRMIEWTLRSQPLERPKRDPHQSTLYDALNLCCNLRGIGWPWSKGLHIPPETRPTHSNAAFVRPTAMRALRDIVVCDALQATLQHLGPDSFGSLHGGTIFDARLALPQRYLWSSFLSLLTAMGIYFSLNLAYHFATLVAFAISRQDPAAWPPVSRAPWAATSLSDFWGRRWHQVFRHIFVQFGYKPARAVFGPLGGVLGAFLLSGIMHDICIWPMARGTDFGKIGGFFVLSGVGVVVEQAYERVTSRKVQGFAGWLWAMSFLLATGNLLVDAWLTRGLIGSVVFPEPIRPTRLLVQLWRCLRTSSS